MSQMISWDSTNKHYKFKYNIIFLNILTTNSGMHFFYN